MNNSNIIMLFKNILIDFNKPSSARTSAWDVFYSFSVSYMAIK